MTMLIVLINPLLGIYIFLRKKKMNINLGIC